MIRGFYQNTKPEQILNAGEAFTLPRDPVAEGALHLWRQPEVSILREIKEDEAASDVAIRHVLVQGIVYGRFTAHGSERRAFRRAL